MNMKAKQMMMMVAFLMIATTALAREWYVAELSSDGKTLTLKKGVGERADYSKGQQEVNMNVWIANTPNITTVVIDPSFRDARPNSCSCWFMDCRELTAIYGLENLNTSETVSMDCMFIGCEKLRQLDLRSLNTSRVRSMVGMFSNCSQLVTVDLSSFDTSQVKNMTNMFEGCERLKNIYVGSGWNTSAVTESGDMFIRCMTLTRLGQFQLQEDLLDKTHAHTGPGGYLKRK